jgi:hypothetical protein
MEVRKGRQRKGKRKKEEAQGKEKGGKQVCTQFPVLQAGTSVVS